MSDQALYQKIGQLLVDAGPSNAREIVVRAELFSEGDGGKYEFDYIDNGGVLDWFTPDGRAVGDLTELLVQLRDYFLINDLTAGKGAWSGCEISLAVDKMKLGIKFNYDE
ncbi:hypothetical protein EA797_21085 [Stutzerimonas zhaodongensis]|uniref:DUF600 family protein n=1 Tax=Stutzerimonas zhaodongensis TaxID=1176257 RepID=A0A3M2HKY1_9GAMM|nr:hypothetical protein [Stutzerimonas zhaodongensis]MCQ4317773.1 hypothetical protein [Stutzerimonas zhaodongensis]RMH87592.1 hypothetical protein EA797_21085 [Stutzerimonas zhaodongensis]